MNKLAVLYFTEGGNLLANKIVQAFPEVEFISRGKGQTVYDFVEQCFQNRMGIIFISATGIAVRTIAPYLKSKLLDPPVIVVDECGKFIIPILSGHVGGANELARMLANKMGAIEVITTATDLNSRFAIDVFAKRNHLKIMSKEGIVKVSSKILRGETITIAYDGDILGEVPRNVEHVTDITREDCDVIISQEIEDSKKAPMHLFPQDIIVGIGCKRGKTKAELASALETCLLFIQQNLFAVGKLTSIDRKEDEQGIVELARDLQVPYEVFSKEILEKVEGEFVTSSYVESIVGVNNVCTRSAMASCNGNGELLIDKFVQDGITISLVKKKVEINFE